MKTVAVAQATTKADSVELSLMHLNHCGTKKQFFALQASIA